MNNSTTLIVLSGFALSLALPEKVEAQTVKATIDLECQRFLGDVSELDREKYFNIHSTYDAGDFTTEDLEFLKDLGVSFGRGFWGPFGEDGDAPYPSEAEAMTVGAQSVASKQNSSKYPYRTRQAIMTHHPRDAYTHGEDPVPAAEWAANYFKYFFDDETRPLYFEPMNEPFVHSDEFGTPNHQQVREGMSEFYREIGRAFDEKEIPMKVVGYASAWPSMELNGFGHWDDRMKMFMDTAGDYIDAFSTHLYDGINVTGQVTQRSGSNSMAILDLIETYSHYKWDVVKPHALTEFGGIEAGYAEGYGAAKSAQSLGSINHLLFEFFERQDRIDISIPFIGGKGAWYYNDPANNFEPYGAALWRPDKSKIVDGHVTEFLFTSKILFYYLWENVQGKRVRVESDESDVFVQGFVDCNIAYVCLNNIEEETHTVELDLISDMTDFQDVRIKRLKIFDIEDPEYTDETLNVAPATIELLPHETVVLAYRFSKPLSFSEYNQRKEYYTDTHLQRITGNSPISFDFSGIELGAGTAHLRMGIGRKHNVSKQPIVMVNGVTVPVPNDWAGYDQINRTDFFGAIDIPVPVEHLNEDTTVTIQFPDTGGHVSSLILEVEIEMPMLDEILLTMDKSEDELMVTANGESGMYARIDRSQDLRNWSIVTSDLLEDGKLSTVASLNNEQRLFFRAQPSLPNTYQGTITLEESELQADGKTVILNFDRHVSDPSSDTENMLFYANGELQSVESAKWDETNCRIVEVKLSEALSASDVLRLSYSPGIAGVEGNAIATVSEMLVPNLVPDPNLVAASNGNGERGDASGWTLDCQTCNQNLSGKLSVVESPIREGRYAIQALYDSDAAESLINIKNVDGVFTVNGGDTISYSVHHYGLDLDDGLAGYKTEVSFYHAENGNVNLARRDYRESQPNQWNETSGEYTFTELEAGDYYIGFRVYGGYYKLLIDGISIEKVE